MRKSSYSKILPGVLFLSLSLATGASAQVLEEILVTAQKRGAVNLQDISGSVQALSADALEDSFAEGFDDYYTRISSLSAINQGGGQTQIIIRGVTTGRVTHAQPQDRSTAGLYIDETPVTANAFNPDLGLFDINRIEVLKGPQGTLYGASSMSGAIRIITNEPDPEAFDAKVDVTVSTTERGGENHSEKFMVNVPLSDSAAIRAVAYNISDSGFIDNIATGDENYNDEQSVGGRVSLLWQANDRLSLRGTVHIQDLEADGRPDMFRPDQDYLTNAVGVAITEDYQTFKVVDDTFDDDITLLNGLITYSLENHEIVSSTSYLDRDFFNQLDGTIRIRGLTPFPFFFARNGLEPPVSDFENRSEIEDFSQEIRISNTDGGPLGYALGVFYSDQEKTFNQRGFIPGSDSIFPPPNAVVFGAPPDAIFAGDSAIKQEQVAVFGEVSYQFSDRWEAAIGLRWFDWEQTANIRFAGLVQGGVDIRDGESSESGVTPKFRLSYAANEDMLIYASAGKGFRIGGVNEPVATGICGADLALIGATESTPEAYDSDDLWSFEVGAKTSWMDNRLYVNGSIYVIDWEDLQTSVLLPSCGFSFVDNSGDAEIWGGELEIQAALTEFLSGYLNASYTDGELTSNPNNLGVGLFGRDGDRIPNVPKWIFSAGADYTAPLSGGWSGGGWNWFVRGGIQYRGSSLSLFNPDASARNFSRTPEVPSSFTGDISLGFENQDWQLSLFVKNVSDERTVTAVDTDRVEPITDTLGRPRTIGVNLRRNF